METCAVCGFAWDSVPASAIERRVAIAVDAIAVHLDDPAVRAVDRPTAGQWSILEYAAHVRDVLLNLRDRIVLGAVEDHPMPKSMYADARVALGLYATETPAQTTAELRFAAALFGRTFAALTIEQLTRQLVYPWPRLASRTLLWVAAQAVHEVEHHCADIAAVRDQLTS